MLIVILILSIIFAGIETVRSRSFGWAAVALLGLFFLWPLIPGLK